MLDLTKLNDGDIVVIPRDLANPKPDRRQRYDWRAKVTIPAGTKLRVLVMTDDDDAVTAYYLTPIKGYRHQDLVYRIGGQDNLDPGYVSPADKLAAAVLEVAVPGKLANLGDVLGAEGLSRSADALLAVLIDQGKLDLGDVKGAIDAYRANDEPYETFNARHGV